MNHTDLHSFRSISTEAADGLYEGFKTFKLDQKRMPSSIFSIASDSLGNQICLDNTDGQVYLWDHEREVDYTVYGDDNRSNLYPIASSLHEFLNYLYSESEDAQPIEKDLRAIGLDFITVWGLTTIRGVHPEALPILVKHLTLPYREITKNSLIRALLAQDCKGMASQAVLEAYHQLPENIEHWYNRWLLGCLMYKIMLWSDLEEVIAIVADQRNGGSRDGFIRALGKWKQPAKRAEILQKAGPILERIAKEDANESIRQEAQKVLERLQR